LIKKIRLRGRPNTNKNKKDSDTWKWVINNRIATYEYLCETVPSEQELKIIKKLNELLDFVKKNKRQPDVGSHLRLAQNYQNLVNKKVPRSNKFYTTIIKEIESFVQPQHRSITMEFCIQECKKYKSLSEINEKDRSFYKQMVVKPWFPKLRNELFPKARKHNMRIVRSDGEIYIGLNEAANKNSTNAGRIWKAIKYGRTVNGFGFKNE